MKSQIISELQRLESEKSIKIVYAVESGSRAWGFASVDSDWDVRFLYIHSLDWYLKIDTGKDSYEHILENDIDLSGWELRKALRLYRKSNPPLLEWLASPLVYMEAYSTAEKLRRLMPEYYQDRSCMHHYLSMAMGNYREYLQGEVVRVKKYFYALRPLLACEWIRAHGTMVPMEFEKLLESGVTDHRLKSEVNALLERKRSGEELREEARIKVINDYIEDRLSFFSDYVGRMELREKADSKKLDRVFLDSLEEAWS